MDFGKILEEVRELPVYFFANRECGILLLIGRNPARYDVVGVHLVERDPDGLAHLPNPFPFYPQGIEIGYQQSRLHTVDEIRDGIFGFAMEEMKCDTQLRALLFHNFQPFQHEMKVTQGRSQE